MDINHIVLIKKKKDPKRTHYFISLILSAKWTKLIYDVRS